MDAKGYYELYKRESSSDPKKEAEILMKIMSDFISEINHEIIAHSIRVDPRIVNILNDQEIKWKKLCSLVNSTPKEDRKSDSEFISGGFEKIIQDSQPSVYDFWQSHKKVNEN